MLSLVEADRAGLPVPPTFLLLKMDIEALDLIIERWKLPLMIRMDFKSLPQKKNLGGILLFSRKSVYGASEFLFDQRCYPMFHPIFDRFKNIYSAGILIEPNKLDVRIEVVGKGFDAGDLRLGNATPHESFSLDLLTQSISNRWTISPQAYLRERKARIERVRRLLKYVRFANQNHVLLPSLDSFQKDLEEGSEEERFIAETYSPLTPSLLRSLQEMAWVAQSQVVNKLPESHEFVASLSYFEDRGWMLWDIYGQWYRRR